MVSVSSLRFDINTVDEQIHHIEGIKSAIALDATRNDQIGLLYIIKFKWLLEIGIFNFLKTPNTVAKIKICCCVL